jgi:hypothetical protein
MMANQHNTAFAIGDVGHVSRPYLIGAIHDQAPQQIGVKLLWCQMIYDIE